MRILYLVLALALALAACAPPPDEPDWCYTYNFLLSDYDVNIQSGQWVSGEGLLTVGNELIVNWGGEYFVEQSYMSVTLSRPDGVVGDIAVSAIANIFGQGISTSFTFPAGSTTETIGINRDSFEVTKTFSLTMQTSQPLLVESLYLAGEGATPFDTNPCGPQTETPTAAPTNTPAPATSTATATRTATPTGTLSLCWQVDFDFTDGSEGWTADFGSYVSGVGFVNATNYGGFFKSNGIDIGTAGYSGVNVSNIRVDYTYSPGEGASTLLINGGLQTISAATASSFIEWNGSQSFATKMSFSGTVGYKVGSIPSPEGSITVTSARFRGYGGTPTSSWISNGGDVTYIPCHDQTPTATASTTPTVLTSTPTATRTRTPLPVTPFVTSTASPTGLVVASPTRTNTPVPTFTRTHTPAPSLTFPPPPTDTPGPTNTPGPTIPASPTYTTATGFPVITFLPPGYTPTYGGTGIPGLSGTNIFGTPEGTGTPVDGLQPLATFDGLADYHSEIYNGLGTAAADINSLPANISGQLPDLSANLDVFAGYAKTVTSGVILQELLGQKFYPLAQHALFALTVVIFIAGLQFVVKAATFIIKLVIWVVQQILRIIPFIG